ncbi:MAG TPA: MFS transporter [Ktedonosporobacter sp.]|nr:MFS transporter [Ktedonosporobacter sp.]
MGKAYPPTEKQSSIYQKKVLGFYLGARTISLLGDRIAELVIPYLLITATGSAFTAGFVGAIEQLPTLLFALWIGVAIDRTSPLKAMLTADFVRATLFIIVALLLIWNAYLIWPLAILLFFIGIANVWFRVAAGAILPTIVARERLVAANGYAEAADAAMTIAGPPLGGFIYLVLGRGASIVANALSFLFSGALLLFIKPPFQHTSAARSKQKPSLQNLFIGVRALARIPQLRTTQVTLLTLNAETSAIVLLIVALSTHELHFSSLNTGIILTGAGIGGLLTSTLIAGRLSQRQWGHILGITLVVMAIALMLLAFANGLAMAFAANMVLDGAAALGFVVAGSVRQTLTPDPFLGQVSAASSFLNTSIRTISVFLTGVLVTTLGQRIAFIPFALLQVVIGMFLLVTPSARQPLSLLMPLPIAVFEFK